HRGRAHPASAQGPGTLEPGRPGTNRTRRRLPLLHAHMTLVRHNREQRLLAQIRNLRRAVGALPDAVVLLDRHGRIRWANPAAGHLLGIERKRDHGKPMAELLGNSSLGDWLRTGGSEPPADIPAPTDPERHLSITRMPFGGNQHVLLARDISHI